MYDPVMVEPMRQEARNAGCQDATTAEAVHEAVKASTDSTLLIFVNSVCGCAAGGARPALNQAMNGAVKPANAITVFAGNDVDATKAARSYFAPYQPSSPQMGLMKDGKLVFMLQRHEIEGRTPDAIASDLQQAFNDHCS